MSGLRAVGPRGESAQDAAYRWLKHHVATLPRYEGTFLTEAEVSEATGTSRTPVREALLRLEAEGFLQIVPKKGAFVPPITDAEVEAVMQARGLVEDWCVRRTAPIAESLALELERLVSRQEDLQDNAFRFIECDREFHRTIVRTAGNPVLAEFYESLRERQVRMGLRAIAASEERTRIVLTEHRAIVEGVRSGDPARAAAALAGHLSGTLAALHLPSVARWAPEPVEHISGDQ
jgi:DNA-binding GntR family transcriptional regulator